MIKGIAIVWTITLTAAFVLQAVFSAPQWSAICEGNTCNEAQQARILAEERAYQAAVQAWSLGAAATLAIVTLGFHLQRRRAAVRWLGMLVLAALLFPSIRSQLFEYGQYPVWWMILVLYAIGGALFFGHFRSTFG